MFFAGSLRNSGCPGAQSHNPSSVATKIRPSDSRNEATRGKTIRARCLIGGVERGFEDFSAGRICGILSRKFIGAHFLFTLSKCAIPPVAAEIHQPCVEPRM